MPFIPLYAHNLSIHDWITHDKRFGLKLITHFRRFGNVIRRFGYDGLAQVTDLWFMKIVVTGSLGNISKPLPVRLIENGHEVTVISSSATKKGIEALGAKAAIGKPKDSIL